MTKEELRTLRKSLKLKQPEMAALIEVPFPTYRNWEGGRSPIDKAWAAWIAAKTARKVKKSA